MGLTVDNDSSDLLIKENEDGGKYSRNNSKENQPPVGNISRVNHPATVIARWL